MPSLARLRSYFRDLVRDIRYLFVPVHTRFLCDSCEYDHGNACVRPQRPNAVTCPDHRKRSGA